MEVFHNSIQSWQVFYATVAAASATLTGLLFVSLSLNRERLKGRNAKSVTQMARQTFGDFLYVLMISLVFIIPHLIPLSLTIALLVLGLSRGIRFVLEALASFRGRTMSLAALVQHIGLPFAASIGLIAVAIAVEFGQYDSIYWLVLVIAALLVTACWNAWLLLMEE